MVRDSLGLNSQSTFHSLRKTNATIMAENNIGSREIKQRLAHGDIAVSDRYYIKEIVKNQQKATSIKYL